MGFERTREKLRRAAVATERAEASASTLVVGGVNDPAEREADSTAHLVVRALASSGPAAVDDKHGRVHRTADIRRSAEIGADGGTVDAETDRSIRAARGAGTSLPRSVRGPMEQAFGADFGGVRVHANATELSDRIQAKAFTVGKDVFFRDALPDMSTTSGQHLVAHELTHTIQQGATGAPAASRARRSATVVRRMPSAATVKERSNKKSKSGTKIFGKTFGATNTYNSFLAAVEAYDTYKSTKIGPTKADIARQLATIGTRIDTIVQTANDYKAKKDAEPDVVAVADELIAMAFYEKRAAADIAAYFNAKVMNDPFGLGGSTWRMELPRDPRAYTPKAADTRGVAVKTVDGGGEKGNNKSVDKVTTESGKEGFFAEGSKGGKYDEIDPEAAGTDNDLWVGPRFVLGGYGVTDQNLNLENRSIAMSRLDQLLKGGLIARTQAAYKGDKTGTFQELAQGTQAQKLLVSGDVPVDDPNFARLLSRMQLIDAIAGQVDRHAGNYFVQRDKGGKVIGITGIDLDMSWIPSGGDGDRGKFDLEQGSSERSGKYAGARLDWYPGFSRFVDKEMAETIIALKLDDLRAILIDLIGPAEIQAAVERLAHLQRLLLDLQKKNLLLGPNDWTDQVRADILSEGHSYYAEIVKRSKG